jgi:hypothetical protein
LGAGFADAFARGCAGFGTGAFDAAPVAVSFGAAFAAGLTAALTAGFGAAFAVTALAGVAGLRAAAGFAATGAGAGATSVTTDVAGAGEAGLAAAAGATAALAGVPANCSKALRVSTLICSNAPRALSIASCIDPIDFVLVIGMPASSLRRLSIRSEPPLLSCSPTRRPNSACVSDVISAICRAQPSILSVVERASCARSST